ncbi:HEAT repeat domain-containing protein [Sinomonas sp. P47F7]|uniref:HEAT repeat domain-containing protein n=1 Tax=Sinomonas sp. P47F7 TaxID=3410987 RepID=UPI003BF4663B
MEGLFEELAAVGYPVGSVSELRVSRARYVDAVPVLVRWLARAETPNQKEEIVRALSVPWARTEALGPLIEEFRAGPVPGDPRSESLRWAVGNGIEVLWDDSRFNDLIALARDERYGKAREMVVLGLGRSKRPEAGVIIVELLDDPVVNGHAVKALGKLGDPRAREGLRRMVTDDRAWVRKEAERALAKLA